MGLDYDKLKRKEEGEGGSQWASYSDLFMVLSFVFLLLYVTASIRSGTFSIQKHMEYQELAHQAADLKEQIKVYNTLKEDYLQKEATRKEQDLYVELMDKLNLLQEEAADEKMALRKQAAENEAKERALNKYQQMVRNIINTNMLAKKRIERRDKIIVEKDVDIQEKKQIINEQADDISQKSRVIASQEKEIESKSLEIEKKQQIIAQKKAVLREKNREIQELNSEIEDKKKTIIANEGLIETIEKSLSKEKRKLQAARKSQKLSKAAYRKQLKKLQEEKMAKIQKLRRKNIKYSKELANVKTDLSQASTQLTQANQVIAQQEAAKDRLERELQVKTQEAKAVSQRLNQAQANLDKVNSEIKKQLAAKKQLSANLKQQQAQAKEELEKAKQQAAQEIAKAKQQAQKEHQQYLDNLKKVQKEAENKQKRYVASLENLKQKNVNLSDDLKKAQRIANARKKLVNQIKKNFGKAGIKAEVDNNTGDVILSFGDEYFDTGKAQLKGTMKQTLKKFMPTYARSLFEDPKVAEKIKAVEIVGFSSPTYKGKFVDPQSLSPGDREAVSYNLDLSYRRAKAIFNHIFDKRKLKYKHQRRIYPMVKVTGRSFLAEEIKGRDIASGMSQKDYCKKYDCKKSQRVIIKFNLDD